MKEDQPSQESLPSFKVDSIAEALKSPEIAHYSATEDQLEDALVKATEQVRGGEGVSDVKIDWLMSLHASKWSLGDQEAVVLSQRNHMRVIISRDGENFHRVEIGSKDVASVHKSFTPSDGKFAGREQSGFDDDALEKELTEIGLNVRKPASKGRHPFYDAFRALEKYGADTTWPREN